MMIKRCITRTVLGVLNQAAQKFVFTLEKIPWVWGHVPPVPSPYGSAPAFSAAQPALN